MTQKQLASFLWMEKYRPTCISEMILPMATKRFFTKMVKNGEIPHLFLYSSSPGTGKTTAAFAICEELDVKPLYINCSSDTGIDTLRSRILKYATAKTLRAQKTKIIILDEFDGAGDALQRALRSPLEKYANHCRFIITANYATRIINPLKSRCQDIDFNVTSKKVKDEVRGKIVKRLCGILGVEEVSYEQKTIEQIVDTYYPDMRKMLNIMQKYSDQNGRIDDDIFSFCSVEDEFFDMIVNKQFTKARQYVIESNFDIDELWRELYDKLLPRLDKPQMAQALITIAKYQFWSSQVVDKEINFAACLIQLITEVL